MRTFSCREITPMPLERVLEPEVMDSHEEAADYDAMDHREVNRVYVDDLLASVQGSGFRVQQEPEAHTQYSVLSTESSASSTAIDNPKSKIESSKSSSPEPSCLDILDLGTGTA